MNESRSHLVVLAIVAVVVAVSAMVGLRTPAKLGLDLQGGLEVVLQANPKKNQKLTAEDLTKSVEVIRNRVDRLGVAEPEIRTQGRDQIAIELPGIKDADAAVDVVGSTAQLFFYDFNKHLASKKAYRTAYLLLKPQQARAKESFEKAREKLANAEARLEDAKGGSAKRKAEKAVEKAQFDETYYLFDDRKGLVAGPEGKRSDLLLDHDGKLPKGFEIFMVPIGEVMLHGDKDQVAIAIDEQGKYDRKQGVFLLMEDKPGLSGTMIKNAQASSSQGQWVTDITFTREGGRRFGDVTAEIAREGALAGFDQSFAIVLDDEIKSTPTIDYKRYPNGIRGTQAQITGLDSNKEARNLALVLNTGALPVRFEVISKTQVSATLGEQSLREGLIAGGAGLIVVMVYLILFYRFLGLVADLALLAYAVIFYALIVGIPIVMTLPGIAGVILTIGVAADANIVIFERIREEMRAGRSVRASIAAGYSKGLHTILDANAVTLITAFILFLVGAGSVRGFALLLGVGTVLSMFTAVAATFAMLGVLGRSPVFRHPSLIGGSRSALRFNISWMRMQKAMFVWTAVIIVFSLAMVAGRGLKLGVDFKSGTKFDVVLEQKVDAEKVRSVMSTVDSRYSAATIQKTEEPSAGGRKAPKDQSSFTVRVERLAGGAAQQQRAEEDVRRALDRRFGLKTFNVQTIGPSFGRQIMVGALVAIFVSLLLEVIYIWLRFELKFAIPVLIALAHDLIVAVGFYALAGREFKSSTVAALLTILGYSLYDTIIVFDRVRENVGVLRKSSYSRIVNASLNEVLTRSLNTTLVVLIPIGALLFFGGETLKDFAFALLVGVFSGAYSSLIVAAPILCWIKEREPEWGRRRDGGARSGSTGRAAVPATAAAGAAPSVLESGAEAPANGAGSAHTDAGEGTTPGESAGAAQRRRDRRSRAQRRKDT